MKVAIASTCVPFIYGGGRNIVDWLAIMLQRSGHEVEVVYLPSSHHPERILQESLAYRWIDLDAADRVICIRPQAHLIEHDHKILWFIHHIRPFYDLWDSPYRGFERTAFHDALRKQLIDVDTRAINEARQVFTNSQVVSDRLLEFNGVASEVLYPPIFEPERFARSGYNDEIAYVCRVEDHKRQHLLIEAMAYVRTPVKLRLVGTCGNPDYLDNLSTAIRRGGLKDRVRFDNRWVTEEEKVEVLGSCLAAAYLPFDEDSYGYPSIEASLSSKAILTTNDSGGVPELVTDGYNGFVCDPKPEALAERIDQLYLDRHRTLAMGANARARLDELNISWEHVLDRLLA